MLNEKSLTYNFNTSVLPILSNISTPFYKKTVFKLLIIKMINISLRYYCPAYNKWSTLLGNLKMYLPFKKSSQKVSLTFFQFSRLTHITSSEKSDQILLTFKNPGYEMDRQ